MDKRDFFDLFSEGFTQAWKYQMLQGVLFLLFGIVIFLVPRLLVAMISSFFIMIGILFISSAWKARHVTSRYDGFRDQFFEEHF
jgi:uncharacterized membrane protein HdeD (DUF308 family)